MQEIEMLTTENAASYFCSSAPPFSDSYLRSHRPHPESIDAHCDMAPVERLIKIYGKMERQMTIGQRKLFVAFDILILDVAASRAAPPTIQTKDDIWRFYGRVFAGPGPSVLVRVASIMPTKLCTSHVSSSHLVQSLRSDLKFFNLGITDRRWLTPPTHSKVQN